MIVTIKKDIKLLLIKRDILFLILLLEFILSPTTLFGQKSISVIQVKSIPAIDGIPRDIELKATSHFFYQLEPSNGEPSPSETRIAIMQSIDTLYFAIWCFQNAAVTAKIQVRDKFAQSDDGIFLVLGTYNDNRNAFCFGVNPLSTQTDFKLMDDGRTIDYNWDTEWICKSEITDKGWFTEIAIPFRSIKFTRGKENWQVNFRRIIREDSEISYWSGKMNEEFKISSSGMLNDIKPAVTKNSLMIVPYGMGKVTTSNEDWSIYKFNYQIGGDINWQVNSNLTNNITINPEFATVEADEDVIDLTKYEIAYPEKRIYFQEGNEMFNTRLRSFYSRRIEDISAGGKLTGKIGKNNINLIQVFDKNPVDSSDNKSIFTILRLKRDILKSSSFGFTATNRFVDDIAKTSLSADYVLNLGPIWKLTGQYVAVLDNWQKFRNGGYVRFAAENNFFHWHLRYSYLQGDGFKQVFNESGYINDDDRNEFDSDLSYKWWTKNSIIKYINLTSANNIYWNDDFSKFISWNINETGEIYFMNKFNFDIKYNNEYRYLRSENKDYYNNYISASIGYNIEAYNSASLRYRTGKSFGSAYYSIEAGIRFKALNKISLELKPKYIEFSPETSDYKTAFINSLATTYNFTNDLWIKLICQTNSSNDKIYIYGLAGWRFKPPFGYLYFIVNHIEYFNDLDIFQNKYIAFLKLTYPISL